MSQNFSGAFVVVNSRYESNIFSLCSDLALKATPLSGRTGVLVKTQSLLNWKV